MSEIEHQSLEAKAGVGPFATPELNDTHAEMMRTFQDYKQTNDTRLGEMEQRMSVDVLTAEKLARIDAALDTYQSTIDAMALKSHRPPMGANSADLANQSEHKSAFDAYMRNGQDQALKQIEAKALSVGTDADGGYLVPGEIETDIAKRMIERSPMRAICTIRQVSGSVYKKPFSLTGPSVGWAGETDSRPQTTSQTLGELEYPTMELYAMPAATTSLLDDAIVNIDEWIASEVEVAFAEQETAAFINGDGVKKPTGFLQEAQVDEASWSWGNIGTLDTGVDGGLPGTDPSDILVDLVYALKSGFRQNANWMMNRSTQATLRKLKDADGHYLWQPANDPTGRASFMGFPLVEAEDMPDIATDATPIAFGDFGRGYLIVDRAGVNVLRDPYSAKPYVLFYTTKRVGGGVQDFDAIKLLKFAA